MRNGVDFIYEYSDLNLFHLRVKILTGKYAGIVMEFGGSLLAQVEETNSFCFEYILYEVPDQFHGPTLRKNADFINFAGHLLVDVIEAKRNDPADKRKELLAASGQFFPTNIKINQKFYNRQATVI